MAGALKNSACLVYVGMVMVLFSGSATPAFSLLLNGTISSCSTQCESENCYDPPILRYGKYCGVGYTGCQGEKPCDGLDTCCQTHDKCIGSSLGNYFNVSCNGNLKTCVETYRNSNQGQFPGNNCSISAVEDIIIASMSVATTGGRGNPSAPINLQWAAVSACIMCAVLLFS